MSMLSDAYTLHEIGLAQGSDLDLDLERDIQTALDDLKAIEGGITREQADAITERLLELRNMRRPEFVAQVDKLREERVRAAA